MSELAAILTSLDGRGQGVTFRQGVVAAWTTGGPNSVTVGGAALANLPYLAGINPSAGQTVALLKCANTFLVIGVIVQP